MLNFTQTYSATSQVEFTSQVMNSPRIAKPYFQPSSYNIFYIQIIPSGVESDPVTNVSPLKRFSV